MNTLFERALLTLFLASLFAALILAVAPFGIGAVRILAHATHMAATTRIDCVVPDYDQPKDCPK